MGAYAIEKIDSLAAELGVSTTEIIERITMIGAKDVRVALISGVFSLFCVGVSLSLFRKHKLETALSYIFALAGLASGFTCALHMASAILWLYNADAWTLNYILSKF